MNQDEIIVMARQVGYTPFEALKWEQALTNFAKLVAAKEREACVQICDEIWHKEKHDADAWTCRCAIKSRGEV
jgi:hypothetical protein